jgi:hypothetical protein
MEANSMSVRAKFYCAAKVQRANQPYNNQPNPIYETFEFFPVQGNNEENKKFFSASPSGKLEIGVMNPEAAKQFEVGKSYYLDFTPAE